MPELPELEVVRGVLQRRVVGRAIERVEVVGSALTLRDLTGEGFAAALAGARIDGVRRRGKFLVFTLNGGALHLVINPKLAGRLQLAAPADRRMAKTQFVLTLRKSDAGQESDISELRYFDAKQMGQVYLTREPPERAPIPDFVGMGPEPFDLSLEEFKARLKPFRGEIKGVLVRSEFVAGIGNAYADEILWAARIHPYRKRTSLDAAEVERLFHAMQESLRDAIAKVRAEMGDAIHREPRDFLKVHLRAGEPCPRCGSTISQVSANQRVTNFCRTCQPGGLIRGLGQN